MLIKLMATQPLEIELRDGSKVFVPVGQIIQLDGDGTVMKLVSQLLDQGALVLVSKSNGKQSTQPSCPNSRYNRRN
jgi:hypothetical protein